MNDCLAKRRRALTAGLLLGTCLSPLPARAADFIVSNNNDSGAGSLRQAIIDLNTSGGASNNIIINSGVGTITLTSGDLQTVARNVTVVGNNNTLSGNNQFRGLFIGGFSGTTQTAVTVAISDLTVTSTRAQGGTSADGGGGGAGLGGALFVANQANVTVSNVTLTGNNASGGAGAAAITGVGGGGGMGGNGGSTVGGGGGLGAGADGGNNVTGGQSGIATGASGGGTGGNGTAGGANGGGGGGSNSGVGGGSGAGGGVGGANGGPIGSAGGAGGFGGGGGGGFDGDGGAGGFGGGGGGGGGGGTGGAGGFGGGGGAGGTGGGAGSFGGGAGGIAGGGGLGAGGGVFVQQGGTLTFGGTLAVNGNTVTAGASGGASAGAGSAFGMGLFLQGDGTVNFAPGSGVTQTISDVIADQAGSGGTGGYSLAKTGAGTLVLSAANTYTGGTTIQDGTVSISQLSAFSGPAHVSSGVGLGPVTLDGGALVTTATGSLANDIAFNDNKTSILAAATGTTLTLGGDATTGNFPTSLFISAGAVAQFGSTTHTGTIEIGRSSLFASVDPTSSIVVAGGTLKDFQDQLSFVTAGASSTTVNAGATLDFNDSVIQVINNLKGDGNVVTGPTASANPSQDLQLFIDDGATNLFGGVISGARGVFLSVFGTSGTQVFAGDNTYTGGTTICLCTTLQIGNGGTTGSILGNVFNGGTLVFNRSNSYVFAGDISDDGPDAGKVVQDGTGTTVLTGNNTFTGGTEVKRGSLIIGDGGTAGSIVGNVTIDAGATFGVNKSDTTAFANQITGAGGFVQLGTGTTVFASNFIDYSGTTTISAGTLQIGQGGSEGSIGTGNIINNATLAIYKSADFTLANNVSGTGGLSHLGTAATTFTGTNSYAGITNVEGGTLKAGAVNVFSPNSTHSLAPGTTLDLNNFNQTVGSLGGLGNVTLGAASLTTGGNNDSTVFAGVISGDGRVTKTGTGVWTLNSANSYTGGTILQQGTLHLGHDNALGTGTLTTLGSVVSYAPGVTIANPIVLNSNDTQLEVAFGFATQAGAISETGGARPLEKIGNGALILTGINTYTGGTTISAGTLQLGTPGTQGALAGAVTVASLPATLSIVNADVSAITSILNNGLTEFLAGTTAGSIAITNNRTLDFSADASAGNATITTGADSLTRFFDTSTAGNATIVNNGFVQLTETATAGAARITNNDTFVFFDSSTAGTANFTNTGQLTFQASSSAGGAVINNTGGEVFFTGTSTAANATITNAAAGSIAFFGSASGGNAAIVNDGFFSISGLDSAGTTVGSLGGSGDISLGEKNLTFGALNTNTEISGVIFGDGGLLTKVGTGTTILSGDNEFTGLTTITQGVLQLGNGGATGSVVGDIVNNGVLAINRSNAFDYAGVISGTGALNQIGAGTTTLTGHNTYTGTTTVSAGTLLVNGSIVAPTFVNGGTLGGTGQLGSVTVNAGGTLSPGNSIGTLTINGNLVLGAGAIYRIEVSPTSSDRTNVTGTATLAGTAQLVFGPGAYSSNSYTILSAAGGRSGTFNTLTTEGLPATLSASLSYTATDVLLVTLTSSIAQLPGLTPNQRGVGAAQDTAFNLGLATIPGLNGLTAAQLPPALDALSGEVHASTAGVLVDESRYIRGAVLGRLRQASYGGQGSMASLAIGGPQTSFADAALDAALAYAKSPIVAKAPLQAPEASRDIVFWAQGFGAWGRFDGDGNAASVRRDLAGFMTGLDTRVGASGRAGIAAGYTGSKNALDGRGSANVETGHVAAYGGWSFGALNLRAGGAFAFHTIDTDRTAAFPGFFDRTFAHYDGRTAQVFGEAGYGFAFGNVAVEPFAGGAFVRLDTDAAAERGGLAALNVAANSFEVGYSTLGIRAAGIVPIGDGMVLIPRASAAWQHAFDGVTPDARLAFAASGVPFSIAGVPIARDALLAEAGLDLAIGRSATLGVSYLGQLARSVHDHAAKGRFSWKF